MSTPFAIDERFVARHESFLRRLAAGLVGGSIGRDPEAVDDAVQDVWLRALQAATPRTPRAYLAATLRHALARRGTREAARTAVERRAARGEADGGDASHDATSDKDIVRRLELSEELARALRELPEAQRRALFLRYSEDLSPQQIAARTGEPVGTVKTRLARGLAALRDELDARHGGARHTWGAAALAWVTRAPALVSARSVATARRWLVVLGATTVALAAVTLGGLVLRGAPKPAATEIGALAPLLEPSAGGPTLIAAAAARATNASEPGPTEVDGERDTPLEPGEAQLLVRLVDEAGAPVAGALISATFRAPSVPPLVDWGPLPEDAPRTTTSDANGDATLAVSAYPELDWTLRAKASGRIQWVRENVKVTPGAQLEFGTVVLAPGARLEVTVLGTNGEPCVVKDTLFVSVAPEGRPTESQVLGGSRGRMLPFEGTRVVADDLPAGVATVRLNRNGAASEPVAIGAGEHRSVVLRLDAAPIEGEVRAYVSRIQGVLPETVELTLTEAGGAPRPPDSELGTYPAIWRDVGPGEHSLRATAPGFELLERSVQADDTIVLDCVPNSGVRFLPVDGSGDPVALRARIAFFRPGNSWPQFDGAAPSEAPTIALVPGDHRLLLRGEGILDAEIAVTGLVAAEWRDIEVEVQPARVVAGTVTDAAGAPAPGALVQLLALAQLSDGPGSRVGHLGAAWPAAWRHELAFGDADAEGRFRLQTAHTGPLVVRAVPVPARRPFHPLDAAPFARRQGSTSSLGAIERLLAAGTGSSDVAIALQPQTTLRGRLAGAGQGPFDDLTVRVVREPAVASEVPLTSEAAAQWASVAPTGEFELTGLTHGGYVLFVRPVFEPLGSLSIARDLARIGRCDIPASGTVEFSADLASVLGPPVEIVVRADAPLAWPLLGTVAHTDSPGLRVIGPLSPVDDPSAAFVARGRLRTGLGRQVAIHLNEPRDGWLLRRDVDLASHAGAIVFDVALHEAQLTVVHGSGSPAAGYVLSNVLDWETVARDSLCRFTGTRETDAAGLVTLQRPAGEVSLSLQARRGVPPGPATVVSLAWPPPQGTTIVLQD